MKNWPLIPTVLVVLAVATMVGLGIWQLQRKGEKEALLASYESAAGLPAVAWPSVPDPDNLPFFRKSALMCIKVVGWQSVSGTNAAGKAGFAHVASCQTGGGEGPGAKVAVGWSPRPENPSWQGGMVSGVIAPDKPQLIKLVSSGAVTGLERLSAPSPEQIPNNHLLYAIQWLIFAFAAAVIFVLAVRKRRQADG
jgi:surfeit locus 1 family protein